MADIQYEKINMGRVKGDTGKSAYDIWLDQGHEGSVDDFLFSLKGARGEDGQNDIVTVVVQEMLVTQDVSQFTELSQRFLNERITIHCELSEGVGSVTKAVLSMVIYRGDDDIAWILVSADASPTEDYSLDSAQVVIGVLQKTQNRLLFGVQNYKIAEFVRRIEMEESLVSLPDTAILTENKKKAWRDMIGAVSDDLNIENGTGAGSVQQIADKVASGFNFTGKNPNAEKLDPTLSAVQAYGGVGDYSNAFGGKSSAQGKRSHAEGTTTIAKGNYSHAEGDNSVALGADSHAEGYTTTAHGTGSHTEGSLTLASGVYSHAEGVETKTAEGADGAHAEGYKSEANGYASHAEGQSTAKGNYSHAESKSTADGECAHAEGMGTADGMASHAEGNSTAGADFAHAEGQSTAIGEYSHAEGLSTAEGDRSHAEGTNCYAVGDHSHAGGVDSVAEGWGSFAHGQGVKAMGTAKTVLGSFNSPDGDAVLEVGNGTDDSHRSTAFKVLNDGRAKVQAAPKDPDDVLRKGDIGSTMTVHASTANQLEITKDSEYSVQTGNQYGHSSVVINLDPAMYHVEFIYGGRIFDFGVVRLMDRYMPVDGSFLFDYEHKCYFMLRMVGNSIRIFKYDMNLTEQTGWVVDAGQLTARKIGNIV